MTNFSKRPTLWKQLGAAACISSVVVSAPALAQAPAAERPAPYAMSPESNTLPEKVLRARIPFMSASSKGAAYDGEGKKVDGGLSANVMASGLAVEYGLTDTLSLGMFAPFVAKNHVAINGDNFRNQHVYKVGKEQLYEGASALLIGNGICTNISTCSALLDSGYALPTDTDLVLPTGEKVTIKSGVPINQAANHLIINAANPADGAIGMGDLNLGAKFRWLRNDTMGHAVGLVLHVPTGKYQDVTLSQRATGRGIMEMTLSSSFDYKLSENYIAGWQHNLDYAIGSGKTKRTSLIDNTALNTESTTKLTPADTRDGYANSNTFKRPGIRSSGFVDVKTGLGQFSQSLNTIGARVRYAYDFDTAVLVEDREDLVPHGFLSTERSNIHNVGLGLNFDGFQLENRIPVRVTWDLDIPIMGSNKLVAPIKNTVVTELYYKF